MRRSVIDIGEDQGHPPCGQTVSRVRTTTLYLTGDWVARFSAFDSRAAANLPVGAVGSHGAHLLARVPVVGRLRDG